MQLIIGRTPMGVLPILPAPLHVGMCSNLWPTPPVYKKSSMPTTKVVERQAQAIADNVKLTFPRALPLPPPRLKRQGSGEC